MCRAIHDPGQREKDLLSGQRLLPSVYIPSTFAKKMAWIGKSHGTFDLHNSDKNCGSFLSVSDAVEILDADAEHIEIYAKTDDDGRLWVSELDLHKRWGAGDIPSPHPSKVGAATRSFDELILEKLIRITLPSVEIVVQVPFGRKKMDLSVTYDGRTKGIEFLGPSHFIQQYQRELKSPLERKKEAEDFFGYECILWPYWIQRCSSNIRAVFDDSVTGKASVWSTKAHFGDFQLFDAAKIIHEITSRFRAFDDNGIGYMYLSEHTQKPEHPIVDKILNGKTRIERLIPRDNHLDLDFWIPTILKTGSEQGRAGNG
jgi:hypothetical protein